MAQAQAAVRERSAATGSPSECALQRHVAVNSLAGDAPPKPLTKRQQRSAQRLQEYQEKKRAAAVQELVDKGCELSVAQAKVARLERKQLEERAQAGAAPMEEDATSVDGRPPGQEGQPRGENASPKRARVSLPETG